MTFEERYEKFKPVLMSIARRYANSSPIPIEEYESALSEEFFMRYDEFDERRNNNFGAFMRVILTQKATRIATRKERKYYDSIEYIDLPEESDEETKYPLELVSDVDVEEQIFDVMFVEEQLAKADLAGDDETRRILEVFFAEPNASFREIARQLGLNDKLVKRRLQAVARDIKEARIV